MSCGQFCLHSFAILLALGALVMVIMLATGSIRPPPDPQAWQEHQSKHLCFLGWFRCTFRKGDNA